MINGRSEDVSNIGWAPPSFPHLRRLPAPHQRRESAITPIA